MSEVKCAIQIPEVKDLGPELTVGRQFFLLCEGEWPKLNFNKAELRLDESDKYKLKILSILAQNDSHQIKLSVVSYIPGDHHLKAAQLVDSENSIVLGNLDFTVKSVINPQEPPTEPYGPRGPLGLSLPWWYFALLAVAMVVIGIFIFIKIRRRIERKKLIDDLQEHGSSLTPYHQFTQTIRRLGREHSYLSQNEIVPTQDEKKIFLNEFEKAYRVFLGRSFLVPTLAWSDRLILADIRSAFRNLFDEYGTSIRKILEEFKHAQEALAEVSSKDLAQLVDLARKNVDGIYLYQNRKTQKKAGYP